MTIVELYEEIGGNYEQAVKVMRMDKLIDKHIRRLKTNEVFDAVREAGETMDPVRLFESTHALKGMCANLGLDSIAALASEITEDFRPGASRKLTDEEVKEKIARIDELHKKTIDGITRYEAES